VHHAEPENRRRLPGCYQANSRRETPSQKERMQKWKPYYLTLFPKYFSSFDHTTLCKRLRMSCTLSGRHTRVEEAMKAQRYSFQIPMAEAPAGAGRYPSPTYFLHQSINHSYHAFRQVMSPDRRAYSLKKHFQFAFADLTCHLCRPPPVARGTTRCNMALLRIPTIHQPATKCYLIPFSR